MTRTSLIALAKINEGTPQLGRRIVERDARMTRKQKVQNLDAFVKQHSFNHSRYLIFTRRQLPRKPLGKSFNPFYTKEDRGP